MPFNVNRYKADFLPGWNMCAKNCFKAFGQKLHFYRRASHFGSPFPGVFLRDRIPCVVNTPRIKYNGADFIRNYSFKINATRADKPETFIDPGVASIFIPRQPCV